MIDLQGVPMPDDAPPARSCIRIERPDHLDAGIADMLAHDGPVIVDCMVAKLANCFPMIPSGAAHTDMILQANEVSGTMDDEAKALV